MATCIDDRSIDVRRSHRLQIHLKARRSNVDLRVQCAWLRRSTRLMWAKPQSRTQY